MNNFRQHGVEDELDDGHGDPRNVELLAGPFHHLVDVVLCRANRRGNEQADQNTERASTATVRFVPQRLGPGMPGPYTVPL
jgi:hypothetical protein